MKLIKVILRPEKVLDLKDALSALGYHGITTKHASGYGEQKKTVTQVYRGKVYEQRTDAIEREELEFIVADNKIEEVIETIINTAKTDQGGDGRIYVSPIDNAIHIHTGDRHVGDSTETGFNGDVKE
ncbi:MAG: Nitrogen regulatory protein P-II [Candidatus Scalindua arabica]|uniref:Nitrogen regulatory protein P-II n=1 Tax=Candidatus Scalindua arabica TaxID=1127984 RepID=A0A941W160_9BACT|nr:Nitrogen regulatory protein P-II [Candidatus Scalindua arabica]